MPVIDRDLGYKAIFAEVEALGDKSVFVGSTGDAAEAEYIDPETGEGVGLPVVAILNIHEFGIGVAERSLIRAWAAGRGKDIGKFMREPFAEALKGGDPDETTDNLGELAREDLAKFLTTGQVTPAPSKTTIELRRLPSVMSRDQSGYSLLDSHQILGSLDYRVD